jgi:two-component system response regulator YesN
VEQYLKIDILIRSGTLKEDWRQIHESATEAFVSINAQLGANHPTLNGIHLKFYHSFAQAVRNSQVTIARELAQDYFEQLADIDMMTLVLQQHANELWTILTYCLYDAGVVLDDIYPKKTLLNELALIETVKQFESWLLEKIDMIMESRDYKENIKHKKAIDTITEYIHEHYTEDITLDVLSDMVATSRTYLCYIFKKVTGETFNQYLTRVRMEKAKKLVLEGKWMVYEIAEMVGYKNIPYFSALFKKTTGCTPMEFSKASQPSYPEIHNKIFVE